MENFLYERSYIKDDGDDDTITPAEEAFVIPVLNLYQAAMEKLEYHVYPGAPAIFNTLVSGCDKLAREFSGRIKAVIDYTVHEATIELWCCFIEFQRDEFTPFLQKLSRYASSVKFTGLTTGEVYVLIHVPYFFSFLPEELEEEI